MDAVLAAGADDVLARHERVKVDLRGVRRASGGSAHIIPLARQSFTLLASKQRRLTHLVEGRKGDDLGLRRISNALDVLFDVLDTPCDGQSTTCISSVLQEMATCSRGRTIGDTDAPNELLLLRPLKRTPALLAKLRAADGRVHEVEVNVAARGVLN